MRTCNWNKCLASSAILILANCILGIFAANECKLLEPDSGVNILEKGLYTVDADIDETKFLQLKSENVVNASIGSLSSNKYISMKFADPSIEFSFKPAIREYVEEANGDSIYFFLNVTCKSASAGTENKYPSIIINLKSKKGLAKIEKDEKALEFSSPIPSKITLVDNQVSVSNENLPVSGRKVTFSVEPVGDENLKNSFEVNSRQDTVDKRKFYLVLRTKTALDLTENIKLKVTATDENGKQVVDNFELKMNSEASLPEFKQDFYKADLSKEKDLKDKGAAVAFNPEIVLSRGSTKGLKYDLIKLMPASSENSSYTQYFDITPKNDTAITVKVKNFKGVELGNDLLLILEAKNDFVGAKTVLYFTLPSGVAPAPDNTTTTTPATPTEEGGMSGWWWVVIVIAIIAVIGGLYYLNKRYLKLF